MKRWITKVTFLVAVVAASVPAVAHGALLASDSRHATTPSDSRTAERTRTRPVALPPAAINAAATEASQNAMAAGVPAVQIAVSRNGRIIYSAAFGVTNKENAAATTARSAMQIGSVTKQFTAAGILRLVERGLLTLDDRIEKFVPEFDPRGRTVTIRHLLTHTSGLPRDWMTPTSGVDLREPTTRASSIASLNAQPFDFEPGTNWSYSNVGFMLLGYAIESISGKSFADFMHSEFTLPLGLLDTGVCGANGLPVPEGYGLTHTPGAPWQPRRSVHQTVSLGSGSFCSTATDLALWSHLLANGQAILPASYATMTTPGRLIDNSLLPGNYAFGVSVQKVLGKPAVWHGGAIDGFQSFLLYFPEPDLAVAVITNGFPATSPGNPELIARAVATAALNVQ